MDSSVLCELRESLINGAILHSELVTVTLRQHARVGEWEPATPGKREVLVKLLFSLSAGKRTAGETFLRSLCMDSG